MNKILQISIIIISIITISCKLNNNSSDIIFSTYGSMKSHNSGKDCMNCHKSGGDTGIIFSIAGTVFKSNLNQTFLNTTISMYDNIDLFDVPIEILEVDGKGNFYTNIPIDWQNGLFASVLNNNEIRNMNGVIFDGSCNACHGITIPYIDIE